MRCNHSGKQWVCVLQGVAGPAGYRTRTASGEDSLHVAHRGGGTLRMRTAGGFDYRRPDDDENSDAAAIWMRHQPATDLLSSRVSADTRTRLPGNAVTTSCGLR